VIEGEYGKEKRGLTENWLKPEHNQDNIILLNFIVFFWILI
jgi:hypothetical protein